MAEELRAVYGNIPGAVRAVFRDPAQAKAADERLRGMGLAARDVDIIPVTSAAEAKRVARPLLEVIGLRKPKAKKVQELKFRTGDTVVLVRLRGATRSQVEATLQELGAEEIAYFGPPGETGEAIVRIAPARIGSRPSA